MSKKDSKSGSISRRRLLATASAGAALAASPLAVNLLQAEGTPIKIGMSMPQTGGLAGGGKPSLLGIEIWRDDVNAKGGLLGRKVELVVYDDKSSASSRTIMPLQSAIGRIVHRTNLTWLAWPSGLAYLANPRGWPCP